MLVSDWGSDSDQSVMSQGVQDDSLASPSGYGSPMCTSPKPDSEDVSIDGVSESERDTESDGGEVDDGDHEFNESDCGSEDGMTLRRLHEELEEFFGPERDQEMHKICTSFFALLYRNE